MSVSYIEHYGLLDHWRRAHNVNIWHFNQIVGAGAPVERNIEAYTRLMRDYIARELNDSFWTIAEYLNYPPLPVYIPEPEPITFYKGIPMERQRLHTRYRELTEFGTRATTLIQAGANVSYSDDDGDGVDDLGTITITSTVAAGEIQIFYRVADGAPAAADPLWQIRPASVSKSGTTVTIKAHRAQFVKPSYIKLPYDDPNYVPEDKNLASTAVVGDFVDAVDVYRVYSDSTDAVKLQADPLLSGDHTTTSFTETSVNALIVSNHDGLFSVRPTNSPCPTPERVYVSYKAGLPLRYENQPDHSLIKAIIALTDANLPMTMEGVFDPVVNSFSRYRNEAKLPQRYVNNPFGTLEGHLTAWRIVEHRARMISSSVTRSRWL